jgi:hypothetical protein
MNQMRGDTLVNGAANQLIRGGEIALSLSHLMKQGGSGHLGGCVSTTYSDLIRLIRHSVTLRM